MPVRCTIFDKVSLTLFLNENYVKNIYTILLKKPLIWCFDQFYKTNFFLRFMNFALTTMNL